MKEVLRQEKKYLIDLPQMYDLGYKLSQVMTEDCHNCGSGYTVRSLYFDTLDDSDYYEKANGIDLHHKIRLRTYGPTPPFVFLEMKQRQGSYQRKRSLPIKIKDVYQLIQGDYRVLLNYPSPFAAECHAMLQGLCYRPRSVVEHRRKAFSATSSHTRITLDYDIRATESNFDLCSPSLSLTPILNPNHAILEAKFNHFLPDPIKKLIHNCDRLDPSMNLYRLSRSASIYFSF